MSPLRKRMIEDMKIRDYSEHTISAYVSAVYRLAAFYHKSPDKLGREEVRAFLVDLVEDKKVSWPYYRQVLAALRFLYRHVLRRGEVVEDVRGPRPEKKLPIVLSVEEVSRFFKALPSLRHRTILMLAYGAGLRVGEAVRVRLADIDRQRKVLRVSQGKGKKDRYTILSPAMLEMLDRYCWAARPEDLLFTTRSKDRPIAVSTVQGVCKQAQRDAGIDKTITPHTLRHSFAIHCVKRGMTIERLQKILGHSSPTTTSVYLQYSLKDLHEDYDKVWEEDETAATTD